MQEESRLRVILRLSLIYFFFCSWYYFLTNSTCSVSPSFLTSSILKAASKTYISALITKHSYILSEHKISLKIFPLKGYLTIGTRRQIAVWLFGVSLTHLNKRQETLIHLFKIKLNFSWQTNFQLWPIILEEILCC